MASMNTSSQRGPPRGRHSTRGGIQKKGHSQPRMDRDGDLNMDGPARDRGGPRAARSSSTSQNRNGGRDDARRSNRPARNPFATVKRAMEQPDGKSKFGGAARFAEAMGQASQGFHSPGNRSGLAQLTIRGWSKSKAASNPGGCEQQLVEFLERKASGGNPAERKNVRISKSHTNGDTLTISVDPDFVPSLLRIDNYTFAGAPLSIKEKDSHPRTPRNQAPNAVPTQNETASIKDRITSMLGRRYNAELKLLDLSQLGSDPEFANTDMFGDFTRVSKFFQALMAVCDQMAPTPNEKRKNIQSVTLANNNLPNVQSVTTLAEYFPDLKNLDLSNNNLASLKAIEAWRRKFRSLEHLVLSNNPLEANTPTYNEDMLRWFPKLRMLNNVQVRTDEQVAAASNGQLVIPVARPCFKDESAIGENFIKFFFPNYDTDRAALVASFYDSSAKFSYSVNVSAKRLEEKTADWGSYIKNSRNMIKITSLHGRRARLSQGTDQIRETWSHLPLTRHPDLATESDKWCIECHPLAGLPDPNAAVGGGAGVGGLILSVHGEFGEVDVSTMQVATRRSFDRTFVLGPGGGLGGIRVISDMMVVRAYGGHDIFRPTDASVDPTPATGFIGGASIPTAGVPPAAAAAAPTGQGPVPGLVLPDGFAAPVPGKPDEQLQKERIVLELSRATGLTVDYAVMCLEPNDWNLEMAAQAFQEARATLPPEAFFRS